MEELRTFTAICCASNELPTSTIKDGLASCDSQLVLEWFCSPTRAGRLCSRSGLASSNQVHMEVGDTEPNPCDQLKTMLSLKKKIFQPRKITNPMILDEMTWVLAQVKSLRNKVARIDLDTISDEEMTIQLGNSQLIWTGFCSGTSMLVWNPARTCSAQSDASGGENDGLRLQGRDQSCFI